MAAQTIHDETRGEWRLTVTRRSDGSLRGRAVRIVAGRVVAKFGGDYPAGGGTTPDRLLSMLRAWLRLKERV